MLIAIEPCADAADAADAALRTLGRARIKTWKKANRKLARHNKKRFKSRAKNSPSFLLVLFAFLFINI